MMMKTTTDPIGATKCPTHQENKIPANAGPNDFATDPPSWDRPCIVPLYCNDTVRFDVIVMVEMTNDEQIRMAPYNMHNKRSVGQATAPSGVSLLVINDNGIKQLKGTLKKAPIDSVV